MIGALFVHVMWISIDFLWGSQGLTELEGSLVGYDRWLKMINTPQEANQINEMFDSKFWPQSGNIEFRDFYLKYRPDTELVLKNLSFSITDNQKIGVVGRTGAGKSTLCLALCRIVEAHSGSIVIDGVDISQIGLEQLRDKITIIPQDPTLFNGTLRFNLDPQGIYTDQDLLELTSQAALDKLIARDDKGLDQLIEEHGQNLSSGEKQLLCICRAILKQNKVVLMDEATANIDIKTEQVIQRLIKEKFKDSTVITIAHRLNTIINSDKVLVLSKGEISEFDSPQNLLKDKSSEFYSYVNHLK